MLEMMMATHYTIESRGDQGLFDAELLGRILEAARGGAGFGGSAVKFSEAIEQCTGVVVPWSSILKMEKGDQIPTLQQFTAIILTVEQQEKSVPVKDYGEAIADELLRRIWKARRP